MVANTFKHDSFVLFIHVILLFTRLSFVNGIQLSPVLKGAKESFPAFIYNVGPGQIMYFHFLMVFLQIVTSCFLPNRS